MRDILKHDLPYVDPVTVLQWYFVCESIVVRKINVLKCCKGKLIGQTYNGNKDRSAVSVISCHVRARSIFNNRFQDVEKNTKMLIVESRIPTPSVCFNCGTVRQKHS